MNSPSLGFIGGGRITRIFLGGWQRAGALPGNIIVSDSSTDTLGRLQREFPSLQIAPGDNCRAAAQALVFLAVHPPAMTPVLSEIASAVAPESLVVSLAPKLTLAKLGAALVGHLRMARVIPNAPSLVGSGFNPVVFAPGLPAAQREALLALLAPLGEAPEVEESTLEGYALLTAMGPTYFWFQLEILRELGRSFGLADAELEPALKRMFCGAARTLLGSGLTPAQVLDLIPVKPLLEDEPAIRQAYQARLPALFAKIKP